MRFNKALVTPSVFNKPNIDVTDGEKNYEWHCIDCREIISLPLKERLRYNSEECPTGTFSDSEVQEIRDFYAMGEHSRSPCGGYLFFERVSCPLCRANYLFTYGIHEPANSYLVLTVQGVVHIERKTEQGSPSLTGAD